MLTVQGHSQRLCNGVHRREVLRAGGAGLLGTSLTGLLAAEESGSITQARAREGASWC